MKYVLFALLGVGIGIVIMLVFNALKGTNANKKAEAILDKARKDGEKTKRESILEAKEEIHKIKIDA
mgnify:FL=1